MTQRRCIPVQMLSNGALSARLNTLRMWRGQAQLRLGAIRLLEPHRTAALLGAIHRLDDQIASTRRALRRRGDV